MLETLVSVVNFIRTGFYCGLYISFQAGFILVNSLNAIFKCCALFISNFSSFLSVLCESVLIFMQDIVQLIQQGLVLVTAAVETIFSSIATVLLKISLFISSVVTLICSVYNGVVTGTLTIYTSIGQAFTFLRNLLILFGSGVWFLITLVPFLLYYLCTLCISFVQGIYKEICDMCFSGVFNVKKLIKNIVLFIFDVPIESLAGLIVALSLAYTFKQFYVLITAYLKQQLRKVRDWARQHWQVTEMFSYYFRSVTRPRPVQTPRPRQTIRQQPAAVPQQVQAQSLVRSRQTVQEKKNNSFLEDRYCVICQERARCILLLPCRHLCLCSECTGELRYYNEVCPICRTNIESTMKIFV